GPTHCLHHGSVEPLWVTRPKAVVFARNNSLDADGFLWGTEAVDPRDGSAIEPALQFELEAKNQPQYLVVAPWIARWKTNSPAVIKALERIDHVLRSTPFAQ
ncbi:MAG: hypothetical protein JXR96_14900, partial [Deltaproteobacteria bacterium]|nr:hypothetical protein [Deltaproteobacteria bacterium]